MPPAKEREHWLPWSWMKNSSYSSNELLEDIRGAQLPWNLTSLILEDRLMKPWYWEALLKQRELGIPQELHPSSGKR